MLATLGLVLLGLTWPLLLWCRVQLGQRLGETIGCQNCFSGPILAADGWLLMLFSASLLLASFLPRSPRAWRLADLGLRLLTVLLVLAFLVDLVVIQRYGLRLLVAHVADFGPYLGVVWEQASGLLGGWLAAVAVLLGLLLYSLLLLWLPLGERRARLLLLSMLGAGAALILLRNEQDYVHNWQIENIVMLNLGAGEVRHYSDEYLGQMNALPVAPPRCVAGLKQRRNVVLLILESWSPYHSALFSGINDWTPELDRLAGQARRYTAFHSSGFSTNEGLASLLAGTRLMAPFSRLMLAGSFAYEWDREQTLPMLFNEAGYQTAFLTTGPLSFSNKRDWLVNIGFAYSEDRDHPYYQDWPRFAFGGPPDEALYQRALDWQAQADTPYLLVLENVTTHQPYIDPVSREKSLEKTMRYADQQVGRYVEQLRQSGFFDNGMLLIASDHRAMVPMTAAEQSQFGPAAASRIPMLLLDADTAPGIVAAPLQQSDLLPSFRQWLGAEACFSASQASIFTPASTPDKCVLHQSGSQHGHVDVLCPGGHGRIRLDGDDSRFIYASNLSQAQQAQRLRAVANVRHRAWQRWLRRQEQQQDREATAGN